MNKPIVYTVHSLGIGIEPEAQAVTLQAVTIDGEFIVLAMAGEGLRLLAEEIERIRVAHPEIENWTVHAIIDRWPPTVAAVAVLCGLSTFVHAQGKAEPATWRLCALDFVRNASDLANLRLDVPVEKLGPNAKLIAGIIQKDGLGAAGLGVHAAYAQCTEPLALQGPPVEPGDKRAAECAATVVIRLTVLGRIRKGDELAAIEADAPKEARDAVKFLHQTAQEWSFTKAVWASLESGLKCVGAARKRDG